MKSILGRARVESQCADVLSDESKYRLGVPDAVHFPESLDDIRCAVMDAAAQKTPLAVMGGRTGITGASVPADGSVALCLSSMKQILKIERRSGNRIALTCQPGITLAEIDGFLASPAGDIPGIEYVRPAALFYPTDPTEMGATLGGTIATNASGARSYAYGPTRNHIQAITVVLANGETMTVDRDNAYTVDDGFRFTTDQNHIHTVPLPGYSSPAVKNASGYYSRPGMHLIDLFIGSEGTLGIVAQAVILLSPRPQIVAGLTFLPGRDQSHSFAGFLRECKQVIAIEYFDQSALSFIGARRNEIAAAIPEFPAGMKCAVYWEYREIDGGKPFEDVMDVWEEAFKPFGTSFDSTWSGFEPEEIIRLKAFRHCLPELVNNRIARIKSTAPGVRKVSTDASVPLRDFRQVLDDSFHRIESAGLEYVCFGHLGDCHLHINIIPADDSQMAAALGVYKQIMNAVIAAGGSVSAEHGIGKLKRDYLAMMYGQAAIDEMKKIKKALDPDWILSPGNLF